MKFPVPNIKKFVANKQNLTVSLLVIILLIVSYPYIIRVYSSLVENYQKYQEQKAQEKLARDIAEENSKVDRENTRRETLLKKYGITKLENANNCQDKTRKCITQYQIPEWVIDYLFSSYLDTKTGTNIECIKYLDKYIDVKYCDKFFCHTYTKIVSKPWSSSSVVLTEEQKQAISELKSLGFYSSNDKELVNNVMDKCDRLNSKTSFEEFQKEVPSINALIRENPKDPILNPLSRSYINFTILNH